ncbi:MAG TPA: choice-of-anchor V domain-containing protein [Polyangiaceae bacterium]
MALTAVGALTLVAKDASATSNGSDSGCSGKPIVNDVCTACGNCHQGGPAPTVKFAGPATLDAGATGTYTFTVTTTQPKTGVDIAATNGIVLNHGTNTQNSFDELTQPSPQTVSGGATVYSFTMVAPAYAGQVELWGSGMAANGNGNTTGDNSSESTMMVTINGPPNPGGGGAVGDAGTTSGGEGPTGGFYPDGGVKDKDPALAPEAGVDPNAEGLTDEDTLTQNSGSCSTSPIDLGKTGGSLAAAAGVMAALAMTRRRRR